MIGKAYPTIIRSHSIEPLVTRLRRRRIVITINLHIMLHLPLHRHSSRHHLRLRRRPTDITGRINRSYRLLIMPRSIGHPRSPIVAITTDLCRTVGSRIRGHTAFRALASVAIPSSMAFHGTRAAAELGYSWKQAQYRNRTRPPLRYLGSRMLRKSALKLTRPNRRLLKMSIILFVPRRTCESRMKARAPSLSTPNPVWVKQRPHLCDQHERTPAIKVARRSALRLRAKRCRLRRRIFPRGCAKLPLDERHRLYQTM